MITNLMMEHCTIVCLTCVHLMMMSGKVMDWTGQTQLTSATRSWQERKEPTLTHYRKCSNCQTLRMNAITKATDISLVENGKI